MGVNYWMKRYQVAPHCGRMDDHEPHVWSTPEAKVRGKKYHCPGPPVHSKGEKGHMK